MGLVASTASAQITLSGTDHLDIDSELADRIYMYDNSSVNIYDGANLTNRLYAEDQSTITLYGGSANRVYVEHDVVVNVLGGYVYDVGAGDNSSFTFTGGEAHYGAAYGNANGYFYDGRIQDLTSYDTANLWVTGGSIVDLETYDSSTLNMTAGSITNFETYGPSFANLSNVTLTSTETYGGTTSITNATMNHAEFYGGSINISNFSLDTMYGGDGIIEFNNGNVGFIDVDGDLTYQMTLNNTSVDEVDHYSGTIIVNSGSVVDLYRIREGNTRITGGSVEQLVAYGTGQVELSGGSVTTIEGSNNGVVSINADKVTYGPGLTLNNGELTGAGRVTGTWADGTEWSTSVSTIEGSVIQLSANEIQSMTPDGPAPAQPNRFTFELPFSTSNPHLITRLPGEGSHANNFAIDFAGGKVPILAALSGTAVLYPDSGSGFGNVLVIDHGAHPDHPDDPSKRIFSFYSHLGDRAVSGDDGFLTDGGYVSTGEVIGTEGNTGYVIASPGGDGTHLHWDVYVGNPYTWFAGWTSLGLNDPVAGLYMRLSADGTDVLVNNAALSGYDNKTVWSRLADPTSISRLDAAQSFDASTTLTTSETGTVIVAGTQVSMATASPVWFADRITLDQDTNLISFAFDFVSEPGAEGLLQVYWNGDLVGTIDERNASADAMNEYALLLPEEAEAGLHTIAFRLDSYTDVQSVVTLDQISTGWVQVVPEPTSLMLLVFGSALLIQRRRVA